VDRPLPAWAQELITLYESNAASQFIVYGNIEDRLVLPGAAPGPSDDRLDDLKRFLLEVLLPGFDVVLSYDVGNGIRIDRGGDRFSQWPAVREGAPLPKAPHGAIDALTRYLRFVANLASLQGSAPAVACLVRGAHLVAPAEAWSSYETHAVAVLLRDWAADPALSRHRLVSFLLTENLNDLHPLLARSPRTAAIKVPLPTTSELTRGLEILAPRLPRALGELGRDLPRVAGELTGASLLAVEKLLSVKEYQGQALSRDDLVALKKGIVEEECGGLIEFVRSTHTLEDYAAPEPLKRWLRQDLELWRRGEVKALPKGYLFCGPVGTGKTFLAECLAGEAGVPVVVIKNFRDRWVGTTEGNLEKIFRLLQALGRCFVFIDEADQTLGRRDSGAGDSGLSGRVYSMIAQEMGSSRNRGRVLWVLASSRPDLIEVDLKRPGRVDCKIPLFPAGSAREGFRLLQLLGRRYGLALADEAFEELAPLVPELLTPAAAEAVAFRAYRQAVTEELAPLVAFETQLSAYRSPVALSVLRAQMVLAAAEATDLAFIPESFRDLLEPGAGAGALTP
jgi:hypothetical protein